MSEQSTSPRSWGRYATIAVTTLATVMVVAVVFVPGENSGLGRRLALRDFVKRNMDEALALNATDVGPDEREEMFQRIRKETLDRRRAAFAKLLGMGTPENKDSKSVMANQVHADTACVGRSGFNAGYGTCDTYGTYNANYCSLDGANPHCSECGQCVDSSIAPSPPPPPPPPPSPPGSPRAACHGRNGFNVGYGPCYTYSPVYNYNYPFCIRDRAETHCYECGHCTGSGD